MYLSLSKNSPTRASNLLLEIQRNLNFPKKRKHPHPKTPFSPEQAADVDTDLKMDSNLITKMKH
jgi:hypothetical protein